MEMITDPVPCPHGYYRHCGDNALMASHTCTDLMQTAMGTLIKLLPTAATAPEPKATEPMSSSKKIRVIKSHQIMSLNVTD